MLKEKRPPFPCGRIVPLTCVCMNDVSTLCMCLSALQAVHALCMCVYALFSSCAVLYVVSPHVLAVTFTHTRSSSFQPQISPFSAHAVPFFPMCVLSMYSSFPLLHSLFSAAHAMPFLLFSLFISTCTNCYSCTHMLFIISATN